MKLLALDISTTTTGWALFENKKLKKYGIIKPGKIKGISKMVYPESSLLRTVSMAEQVIAHVVSERPDHIIIEEVNRGINRLAQKSLDALHFFVLKELHRIGIGLDWTSYMDSNGRSGWRPKLGIKLSDTDKKENAAIRKANKKAPRGMKKDVINWKTLAVRHVNTKYKIGLCAKNDPGTDGDIADAICLAEAFFLDYSKKKK